MIDRRLIALLVVLAGEAAAQIRVTPAVVNVNAQGASTVFLSYGSVRADQYSVEALWCADVVTAAPDIGMKCDPAKTWGRLPLRYDLARPSGPSGFTDIMTIPQNVIRRAYQRAAGGQGGSFYYVRRFSSSAGGADEYIAIICQLAGRGGNVPLALTDVKLRFSRDRTVLSTPVGQPPPPLHADLTYTGSGRLIGRWEVVVPGDELPRPEDLVTEASLPAEQRPAQRRYTQLARFNVHLPATGTYRLPGPDPSRLPAAVEGLYHLLLRIEASDDAQGNTDLAVIGEGSGTVTSGGVAGFPLPMLRYYVGSAGIDLQRATTDAIVLAAPRMEEVIPAGAVVTFAWSAVARAVFYRLELTNGSGDLVHSALLRAPVVKYDAPPLVGERAVSGRVTWRVAALDASGREIARSPAGSFRHGIADEATPHH